MKLLNLIFVAALSCVACLFLSVPGFGQNLVVNGGFETGDFTGWTQIPASNGSEFSVASALAHSGSYSAYFGATGSANDSIVQSLATVAGQSYTIQFWLDHTETDSRNDFSATWNGSPLLSLVNASSFGWTEYTYTGVASGATSTIQFSGREVPALFYLDDISVTHNVVNSAWNGGGADANWTTGGNWGGAAPTAGNALIFSGTNRLTNNNNFAANTLFSGITFDGTAGAFTLNGNPINLGGDVVNNSGNVQTINLGMALQQSVNFNTAGNSLLMASGISGSGSLNVAGPAVLTLTGSNTYTGGTTISSGTLQVGNGGTTGSLAGNVTNNATVVFNRANSLTFGGAISGSGSLTQAGPGILTLLASNSYTGPTTVSGGVLRLGGNGALPAGTALTVNATLDMNGYSSTVGSLSGGGAILNLPAGGGLTLVNLSGANYAGTISGNGGLTVADNSWGAQTLSGTSNSYSGGTYLNAGLLIIAGDGSLGAVPGSPATNITFNGGQLQAGPLALASNRNIVLGGSGGNILPNWGSTVAVNGQISGPGGLGVGWTSGAVVLNGSNSYTSATTIGGGDWGYWGQSDANPTLQLGNNNALPGTDMIFASDGLNTATLDMHGYNATVGALSGGTNAVVDIVSGGGASTLTVGNDNASSTFAGVIHNCSGTLALTKIGSGTLTLTGANTYVGGTTISAGTLQLGDGTTGHDASLNTSSITNNAALVYNVAFGQTANYPISGGTGNLIKAGPGTLTIADTVTFGGINVSGYSLGIASIHQGAISVASGGMLTNASEIDVGDTAGQTGTLTLSGGTAIASFGTQSWSGVNVGIYGGTGQLILTGNSLLDVTATNTTYINIIDIGFSPAGYSGSAGTVTVGGGSTMRANKGDSSASVIALGDGVGGTGTLIIQDSGFVQTSSFQLGSTLQSGQAGGTGTLYLNGGTLSVPAVQNASGTTGNLYFNGGTLQATANSTNFISASGTLNAYVQTGGAVIDSNGNDITVSQALLHYAGGAALDGGLTKLGSGMLTLVGNNTYTGWTTVNAGTLAVIGNVSGGSSTVTADNGGTIALSGNGSLAAQNQYVGYNATGTFTQAGGSNSVSSLLFLGNNAGSSGTYNLSGGQLSAPVEYVGWYGMGTFTQAGGTNSIGSSLCLGANDSSSGTYDLRSGLLAAAYNEIVSIGGTGTFTQSGGTNSSGSSLCLGGNGGSIAFGNGTYNLSGNGLLSAVNELVGDSATGIFTQSGGTNSIGSGGLVLASGTASNGTYNLNGGLLILPALSQASESAAFNFNGGTLQASSGFSTSLPMTLGTSGGGATFDTAGFAMTLSGSLSGPGRLTKVDSGTLLLGTANTYSGNTLVSCGTLALCSPLALQNSTLDTSGSGILSFGSLTAATFGGLAGPGTLTLANSATSGVALSVGNSNASTTFSGMLQGAGSLAKIGSGVLALYGSNIYTGETTITQGKLTVDGWLTNSAASITGGTLTGTGHLSRVTVNPSGNLAPGDSLGTLSVSGNLILQFGAAMEYDLDTPSTSSLVDAGVLTLNGQQFSDFHFATTANFGQGTYNLIDAGSVNGSGLGADKSGLIDGYSATLAVRGNDLVLTVVPEPSTLVLLLTGIFGLIGWVWRRYWARV